MSELQLESCKLSRESKLPTSNSISPKLYTLMMQIKKNKALKLIWMKEMASFQVCPTDNVLKNQSFVHVENYVFHIGTTTNFPEK